MQRAICRGIFAPAQPDFLAASVRDFLSGAYTLHWELHTVRGAMSGALKKKLGLNVESEKADDRGRVYRLAE